MDSYTSRLSHLEIVKPQASYNYQKLVDFCKDSLEELTFEFSTALFDDEGNDLSFSVDLDKAFPLHLLGDLKKLKKLRYRNDQIKSLSLDPYTYVLQPLQSITYAQTMEILHHAPRHPFEFELVDTKTSKDCQYTVRELVQLVNHLFSFIEDRPTLSPFSVTIRLSSLALNNKSMLEGMQCLQICD